MQHAASWWGGVTVGVGDRVFGKDYVEVKIVPEVGVAWLPHIGLQASGMQQAAW